MNFRRTPEKSDQFQSLSPADVSSSVAALMKTQSRSLQPSIKRQELELNFFSFFLSGARSTRSNKYFDKVQTRRTLFALCKTLPKGKTCTLTFHIDSRLKKSFRRPSSLFHSLTRLQPNHSEHSLYAPPQ